MNNLVKIFDHFGAEAQRKKLHEEVDELFDAIAEGNREHIHEEFADCTLLMNQVFAKEKLEQGKIYDYEHQKLQRTIEFIGTGDYHRAREEARG